MAETEIVFFLKRAGRVWPTSHFAHGTQRYQTHRQSIYVPFVIRNALRIAHRRTLDISMKSHSLYDKDKPLLHMTNRLMNQNSNIFQNNFVILVTVNRAIRSGVAITVSKFNFRSVVDA